MAFPLNNLIFLVQFLLLLNGHLFPRTTARPLDDVCRRSLNLAFCLVDFGSNPATRTANLPVLAQIAVDRAQADGAAVKSKIQSLVRSAVDPQIKTLLEQCDYSYIDAVNAVRAAPDDLSRGDYRDLRLHAGQAFDAAERCETSFKSPLKSPVTTENENFKLICDIVGIIADDLNSGKKGKVA